MKRNTTPSRSARRRIGLRAGSFALRPLALATLALTQGAQALPTGGQVVSGQVQISQPSTSTMVLDQGSNKAVVNWQGFGVGAQEKLIINQPTNTSVILNRVVGIDPSYILGQVQANGRVFLLNPNGIVFGQNARVDVGSLVATTLQMNDADFAAGHYALSAGGNGQGALAGRVINQGRISAPHGSVVLAGHEVINSGDLSADGGRVGLIAADKVLVDVEGDGLLFFQVASSDAAARLQQLGRIQADGGSVEMMAAARGQFADTVLNMSGVVQAHTLGMQQGRVVIDGGDAGITAVSGSIDTTGAAPGQQGGAVTVQGQRVLIDSTAVIDASGAAGGGQVRIGGGLHGADASVRNADMTTVRQGARIKANALTSGNGGTVAIWSNTATRFYGNVEARGAGAAGQGGMVEVSGEQYLDFNGLVDLTAASGLTGTLLLDPAYLTIVETTPSDSHVVRTGTVDTLFASTAAGAQLGWDKIGGTLSTSNVTVQTSKDLEIKYGSGDLASANNLTLKADTDITQDSGATIVNTGSGGVTLQAGHGHNISLAADITVNGGVNLQADSVTVNGPVKLDAGAGQLALGAPGASVSGSGNLTLHSTGSAANAINISGAVSGIADLKADGNTTVAANITTTGSQTYTQAVKLASSAVELKTTGSGATIDLQGTVNGNAQNLTLTNTANTAADAIKTGGAISNVAAFKADGNTTLGANVTTTGTQTYTQAVKLASSAVELKSTGAAGQIDLQSTVDGNVQNLTLTNTANTAADAIKTGGAISNVAAFKADGNTTLGANVTTTGSQTYTQAVKLASGAVELKSTGGAGQIDLQGTVNGNAQSLTLTNTANTAAADAIKTGAAITNVAIFKADGNTTLGANVTTTGAQTYTQTVALAGTDATRTLKGSDVNLGAVTGNGKNLTLAASGTATLAGAISGVATLDTTGSSTTALNTDINATTQRYGAATLGGADAIRKLTGVNVSLGAVTGNSKNLTVAASGTATLAGAMSGVATLDTTGSAHTALNTDINATTQRYGAATLGGTDATRTLTGTDVSLGAVTGNGKNLTVAASGTATLAGALSNVATLDTTGSANTALNTDINATSQHYGAATLGGADATRTLTGTDVSLGAVTGNGKNLTVAASGTATLAGATSGVATLDTTGSTTTALNADVNATTQHYGAATLGGADATRTLTGADVNLGAVSGNGKSLTVTASNQATLGGPVAGVDQLTVSGTAGIAVGADVTTAGAQVYKGNVQLTGPARFQAPSLTFNNALAAGANSIGVLTRSWSVGGSLTGTGDIQISTDEAGRTIGVLGGAGDLAIVQGDIDKLTNAGFRSVTIGADNTGVVTVGTSSTVLALPTDLTLQSGADGINVQSAVNGAHSLTLKTSGAVTLAGTVDTAALNVDSSKPINVASNVTTSGSQTYAQTIQLGATAVELKSTGGAGRIDLQGGVDGNAQNLTLTNTANAGDAAAIKTGGAVTNVATFKADGNTTLGGDVTTSATQTYTGTTTLAANAVELKTTGAAAQLDVQGAVNGNGHSLTLTNTANTAAADAIKTGGAISNVADFKADGNATLGGNVTTSGMQTYTGTTTLAANAVELKTTGAAARIDLQGAVNGNGQNLTLTNTANTADADAIQARSTVDNVANLKVDGQSTLNANVNTTGDQAYTHVVTLGSSAVELKTTGASARLDVQAGVHGNGQNLTLTNTANTTAADAIRLSGSTSNVAAFTANGKTTLVGDVGTSGAQRYLNTLTLGADTVHLTTGTTVNIAQLVGNNNALDITAPGGVDFSGAITTLRGLAVHGAGVTRFLAMAGLTTTSDQSYDGDVQVAGDATFGGTSLTVGGSLTGAHNLTLKANQMDITGQLSGTGELQVAPTSAGTTIGLNGAPGTVQVNLDKISGFTRHTIGSANAGAVRANAITLNVDTTIQTGGQALFDGTVDGAHALTVNATGPTTFNANVGGTTPLASLNVSGNTQFNAAVLRTSGIQNYLGNFAASQPFALAASTVNLHGSQDLTFSGLDLANGGSIVTDGVLTLAGNVNLNGGVLTLQSNAVPTDIAFNDPEWAARSDLSVNNLALKEASAAIRQTGGVINTAAGSTLNLQAPNRGSIWVDHTENNINGNLVAVSGPAGDTGASRFLGTGTLPISYVRVDANQIHAAGIEADAVKLSANSLNTVAGTKIRARLPYVNAQGTATSLPALTLVPKLPNQFNLFGAGAPDTWIQVDVGNAAGGYITVRSKGLGAASSAIFLGGPDAVTPFYDGSGKNSEIQIYYNGRTPSTPQEVGALSAVTAVIEESRRARFEEVVRTENVSARLRTGVIAEVGSGRPATEGTDSIRMPQSCTPKNGLGC